MYKKTLQRLIHGPFFTNSCCCCYFFGGKGGGGGGALYLRLSRVDNDRYSSELMRCINFLEQSELKLRIVAPE